MGGGRGVKRGRDAGKSAAELYREAREAGLEDRAARRFGGSMKSLRTVADAPDDQFEFLVSAAENARMGRGYFYEGPTEIRSLGRVPVAARVEPRDPNLHRTLFSRMTGGEASATRYVQSEGAASEDQLYEILHAAGVGQVGKVGQATQNLGAASRGANTEMIPIDDAFTGQTNVRVATFFEMRPQTQIIERIHQLYYHADSEDPIYYRIIDGNRPEVTRSEYEAMQRQMEPYSDADQIDAAARLTHLARGRGASPAVDADAANSSRTAAEATAASPTTDVMDSAPAQAAGDAAEAGEATEVVAGLEELAEVALLAVAL